MTRRVTAQVKTILFEFWTHRHSRHTSKEAFYQISLWYLYSTTVYGVSIM